MKTDKKSKTRLASVNQVSGANACVSLNRSPLDRDQKAEMPLAPFEHFMAADDNDAYPMTFFIRASFEGQFDEFRLEQALWEPRQKATTAKSTYLLCGYRDRRGALL